MNRNLLRHSGSCLILLLLVTACYKPRENSGNTSNRQHGCIQDFDPAKDYFEKKAVLEFARKFSVEYHRSYKVVTVHEPSHGGAPETYVLTQCGAPPPPLDGKLAQASIISIPVVSIFSESATHHQPLIDLGRLDALAGISSVKYAVHPEIIARVREGKTIEYAPSGTLNAEGVIAASPSILMSDRNNDPAFAALRTGRVPVVANVEWLEQSALGRAEWIKFIALFLNEEEKADQRFAAIRDAYRSWTERAAGIPKNARPRVITGGIYRGNYTAAGGRSYVAALIADAGGDYVWSDDEQNGSLSLDIESAIARAAGADYWINGNAWKSLRDMLSDDTRYNEFKAFRAGQVWLYNRREDATGGNDYWSRSVSRPDLILADLIKIFHPDLAKDHEFEWYRRVPEGAE